MCSTFAVDYKYQLNYFDRKVLQCWQDQFFHPLADIEIDMEEIATFLVFKNQIRFYRIQFYLRWYQDPLRC